MRLEGCAARGPRGALALRDSPTGFLRVRAHVLANLLRANYSTQHSRTLSRRYRMELRSWLQKWLGIGDLHQQVAELDRRIGSIETHVASTLQHFGKYRGRTNEELALMRSQLEKMLETVSNVIAAVESQADKQRAARLKAKLKYNLTKVKNAYANRIA
jgi:uncharacterized protein YicC (UPF0701 family)